MRDKLTVIIPVKNERLNIRPCIESVRQIADEIIVADSGSTDKTMDIVRQVGGCRLIEREFIGYSDFKNWAIPQASHPWVLIVDADERITDELSHEIQQVLENPPEHLDGYWIMRRHFFMGHEIKYSGFNTEDVFRLFRRDACRYRQCRVHEEITVNHKRAGQLRNKLLHYTYWSLDQYFEKYVKYTRLSSEDMWEAGKRTSFFSLLFRPFARFFQLYILRRGFLDGLVGIQVCILQAFFVTFIKQARLWEREYAKQQPDPEEAHQFQLPEKQELVADVVPLNPVQRRTA